MNIPVAAFDVSALPRRCCRARAGGALLGIPRDPWISLLPQVSWNQAGDLP